MKQPTSSANCGFPAESSLRSQLTPTPPDAFVSARAMCPPSEVGCTSSVVRASEPFEKTLTNVPGVVAAAATVAPLAAPAGAGGADADVLRATDSPATAGTMASMRNLRCFIRFLSSRPSLIERASPRGPGCGSSRPGGLPSAPEPGGRRAGAAAAATLKLTFQGLFGAGRASGLARQLPGGIR